MEQLTRIRDDLKKEFLTPRLVLGNCHLMDETSKNAPAFCEQNNLPFYYYLGKHLPRNHVINLGFGLGLPLTMYLLAHKPTKLIVQHELSNEFYSPRLGVANVARVGKKKISCMTDSVYNDRFLLAVSAALWGAVIINTQGNTFDWVMCAMNVCWDYLTDDGYICLDHTRTGVGKNVGDNFAKLTNRKLNFISSRYGHSIIYKDA